MKSLMHEPHMRRLLTGRKLNNIHILHVSIPQGHILCLILLWVLIVTFSICIVNAGKMLSLQGSTGVPSFEVITFSDRMRMEECMFLKSAWSLGDNITLLGFPVGQPNFTLVKGGNSTLSFTKSEVAAKLQKPITSLQYLYKLHPDTVVIFVDTDVIFFQTGTEIVESYLKHYDPAIVFSTERNCWPYYMDISQNLSRTSGAEAKCNKFLGKSSFRYLNSGMWMGKAGIAIKMLEQVVQSLKTAPDIFPDYLIDDQLIFMELYLNGSIKLVLDSDCHIFQSAHMTDIANFPEFKKASNDLYISDGKLFNSETGSIPAILHFNGGKNNFIPVVQEILRERPRPIKRFGFLEDICNSKEF